MTADKLLAESLLVAILRAKWSQEVEWIASGFLACSIAREIWLNSSGYCGFLTLIFLLVRKDR
jgi:hypothetical protein